MYLRKKERRSCTKVYSAGARGLPRAKSQDPCPTDPTTPKARFLFAIGILKDGPCCWLRASRSFPTKLQDEPRLGLRLAPRRSRYFGTRRFATCPVPLPRSTQATKYQADASLGRDTYSWPLLLLIQLWAERVHQQFSFIGDDALDSPLYCPQHAIAIIHRPCKEAASSFAHVGNQLLVHQR